MGKADILTKDYMGDANVFADAFNYYIYGGKKVIDPAQLRHLDPIQLGILYDGTEAKESMAAGNTFPGSIRKTAFSL